jgi:hypothetical protein
MMRLLCVVTRLWLASIDAAFSPLPLYASWAKTLREDPRIVDVFERLGLLDYWRASGNWPDFCQTEPDSVCKKMKSR